VTGELTSPVSPDKFKTLVPSAKSTLDLNDRLKPVVENGDKPNVFPFKWFL
jgi:hypothetical protein